MSALLAFGSTFIAVFALGFQSQNVNQGHYFAAALTSFAIGITSLYLYKAMPGADGVEMAAYLLGGASGITASMWVHRRTLGRRRLVRADEHVTEIYPECAECGRGAGEPCGRLICERHQQRTVH